jgi:hypothetical protein
VLNGKFSYLASASARNRFLRNNGGDAAVIETAVVMNLNAM